MNIPAVNAISGADFQAGRIIDDSLFFDGNTMDPNGIQAFLNSKVPVCDTYGTQPYAGTTRASYSASKGYPVPLICLKDYRQDTTVRSAEAGLCNTYGGGTNQSAAQIIYDVGKACGISQKVLLVLLQKEQNLVTDDWPWSIQYRSATGYGCPDTAACDSTYYGFFNQVYMAARQFKKYARDSSTYNYSYNRQNYILYNPSSSCGGTSVYIQNQATAGLYNYTPYQPNQAALNNLYGTGDGCSAYGNRNFWRLYTDWFGSTITGVCYNGNQNLKTDVDLQKINSKDTATFLILSGSGSGCVESHIWNYGFQSWRNHIASNQPGILTPDATVQYGDLDGNGNDYPVLFGLKSTGSGMVESHVWERSMQWYLVHAASNLPAINPADDEIKFADLNGDGKEEPIVIAYRNTGSGMIELHGWSDGTKSWAYHIITNRPAIDPQYNRVVFGNIDGSKGVEAILVSYDQTGSGKIEFHVWNPGQWSWRDHIASNMPIVSTTNSKIEFGDFDGNGTDEAVLIGLRGTGSGKIEFHIWNPGFTTWKDHIASNQPTSSQ